MRPDDDVKGMFIVDYGSDRGMTLIELMISISILGIIAMTSIPLVVDLLSSLWMTQGKAGMHQIGRESFARISDELREAVASPQGSRPWASPDGNMLRFYRSADLSDSIRYYFASNGSDLFLYRQSGTDAPVAVPPYADREVDFIKGAFSVDGGVKGYTSTGKVEVSLTVGSRTGMQPDSTTIELGVFCRNFR